MDKRLSSFRLLPPPFGCVRRPRGVAAPRRSLLLAAKQVRQAVSGRERSLSTEATPWGTSPATPAFAYLHATWGEFTFFQAKKFQSPFFVYLGYFHTAWNLSSMLIGWIFHLLWSTFHGRAERSGAPAERGTMRFTLPSLTKPTVSGCGSLIFKMSSMVTEWIPFMRNPAFKTVSARLRIYDYSLVQLYN